MIDDEADELPSKSERKRQSTGLQELGEALITLPLSEFEALPLPENLRDAVELARRITAHGGLYRQKQYIGKLMRKIDAEPIRAALKAKHDRERLAALHFRKVEQWRDRLIDEGIEALESIRQEIPGELQVHELVALIKQARRDRETGATPKAARELFRTLREAMQTDAT